MKNNNRPEELNKIYEPDIFESKREQLVVWSAVISILALIALATVSVLYVPVAFLSLLNLIA